MMYIIYEASSILEQSQPPTGGGCAFRLKINISNKKMLNDLDNSYRTT